jgi:hypothetical protein
MDTVSQLQSMGLTLPSPAYIIGAIIFSFLGLAAYYYGKRAEKGTVKWLGVALMFYPYVVTDTTMMYIVGVALCGAVYWYSQQG